MPTMRWRPGFRPASHLGSHDALPDPLVSWEGGHPFLNHHPPRRPQCKILATPLRMIASQRTLLLEVARSSNLTSTTWELSGTMWCKSNFRLYLQSSTRRVSTMDPVVWNSLSTPLRLTFYRPSYDSSEMVWRPTSSHIRPVHLRTYWGVYKLWGEIRKS